MLRSNLVRSGRLFPLNCSRAGLLFSLKFSRLLSRLLEILAMGLLERSIVSRSGSAFSQNDVSLFLLRSKSVIEGICYLECAEPGTAIMKALRLVSLSLSF